MATTFLEPGGDADFQLGTTNGFWQSGSTNGAIASDFVHGGHQRSLRFAPGAHVNLKQSIIAGTGSRISTYFYFIANPGATASFVREHNFGVFRLRLTAAGVLQLWSSTAQMGSDGPTISLNKWTRISMAYTLTTTSVNRFEVFVDGVSAISVTNATINSINALNVQWGNIDSDGTMDMRASDFYVDNSIALTDTGNIWVTAKRPSSNGTTNGFTTQIGSGGSGYGTGHSPQVNERPLSTTNGWSMIGAGSAITEEYNIEAKSVGDIDISAATIIDYTGWVSAKTLNAETASIIVNGASSNISLTTTTTLFTKIKGSATYPAGTGTDIGLVTTTALTTVSLYECGVIVAYIPAALAANGNFLAFM